MTAVLVSPGETSVLLIDRDNGSLMFLRVPDKTDGDGDGGDTPVFEPLIESNPHQVAKVERTRRDVIDEAGERAMREQRGLAKAAMGFLPFGKKGFVRRRQRRHAVKNSGQVYFTMTDRGVLVSLTTFPVFYCRRVKWLSIESDQQWAMHATMHGGRKEDEV